jgi:hypothetical protein
MAKVNNDLIEQEEEVLDTLEEVDGDETPAAKKRGKKSRDSRSKIEDSILEPYYIELDDQCFTIFKREVLAAVCYPTTLQDTLKKIIKLQIADGSKTYSLTEYIEHYTTCLKSFEKKFLNL